MLHFRFLSKNFPAFAAGHVPPRGVPPTPAAWLCGWPSAAGRVARRKARASLAGQAAPLGAASRPRGSGRLCGAWGPRVTGVSAVVFGLPAAGAGGHLLAPHSPLGGGVPGARHVSSPSLSPRRSRESPSYRLWRLTVRWRWCPVGLEFIELVRCLRSLLSSNLGVFCRYFFTRSPCPVRPSFWDPAVLP